MNRDELGLELQDFVDGRLPERERQAFEARLRSDTELARRVEIYREMGRLLREMPADLPPGFDTRARARYEASRTRSRPSSRLLSWEAAGLLAATVLVVALLLPTRIDELSPPPERGGGPGVLEAEPASPPGQQADSPAKDVAARSSARPVSADSSVENKERLDRLARSQVRRENERRLEQARGAGGPGQPAEADADRLEERRTTDLLARGSTPAPPASSPEPRDDEAGAFGSAAQAPEAGRHAEKAPALARMVPRFEPIAAPMLNRGQTRVIDTEEDWKRFLAEPAGASLGRLRPDFETERVVLIGPPVTPLACRSVVVVPEEGRYRIRVGPPGAGTRAPQEGCAVVVPAGREPVEVEIVGEER